MLEFIYSNVANVIAYLLSINFIFSPYYLISTIVIAFVIWGVRGRDTGFKNFLLPKSIYLHKSTGVDLKLATFNYVFAAAGALSAFYVAPIVTYSLLNFLNSLIDNAVTKPTTLFAGLITAIVIFMAQDFCRFLNHFLHHKSRILWPFHAVHHSAEVLTPITFMRAHPVYHAIQRVLNSSTVGMIQALVLFLILGNVEFWVIYSSTVAFYVYIFLGAHFRHSHIPLRYGRHIEHILISPTQHQIHHSIDPKHFEKNFGEIFAVWDWMFGTLYIPDTEEKLNFGIADETGHKIKQPHPTLYAALICPFRESIMEMRNFLLQKNENKKNSEMRDDK